MPQCYLVTEIAVECNGVGSQVRSDISVCGIFTSGKLANDAVLTWHERDYIPVGIGDFDSYKLAKPEGLLHLVAVSGSSSWEVTVEMIEMNTEFTMSLLDPSLPETYDQGRPPVKQLQKPTPAARPKQNTSQQPKIKDEKKESPSVTRIKTEMTETSENKNQRIQKNDIVKLKLPVGGDRRSPAFDAKKERLMEANRRASAPDAYTHGNASLHSPPRPSASGSVRINGGEDLGAKRTHSTPKRPGPSTSHTSAVKKSRLIKEEQEADEFEILNNSKTLPSDPEERDQEVKRRRRVLSQLKKLQGWTSD